MITDGRFSGGTHGFVVGHITPEAFDGGNIALIENGDIITIDAMSNTISVDVSESILAERRSKWLKPTEPLKGFLKNTEQQSPLQVWDVSLVNFINNQPMEVLEVKSNKEISENKIKVSGAEAVIRCLLEENVKTILVIPVVPSCPFMMLYMILKIRYSISLPDTSRVPFMLLKVWQGQ